MFKLSIKDIVTIGLLIGLHLVLNLPFLKVYVPICSGTISFKTFPFFLIALKFPFLETFINLFISSLFDWFISGYPFCVFFLDYAIPYTSFAILSIFRKIIIFENDNKLKVNFFLIDIVAVLIFVIRLLSHTFSGYLFYEVSLIMSFFYNIPSCFINDFVNAFLLYFFLRFNNEKSNYFFKERQ